ncbi:hypothetical protein NKG94_21190 [Micromonospora sp. M12]
MSAAEQTTVEFAAGRLVVRVPKGWRRYGFGAGPSVDVNIELPTGSGCTPRQRGRPSAARAGSASAGSRPEAASGSTRPGRWRSTAATARSPSSASWAPPG